MPLGVDHGRRIFRGCSTGGACRIHHPRGSQTDLHQIHCWTVAYPTLSMFDAVTAVVSRRLKIPGRTYDHHFEVVRIEVWRDA